MRKEGLRIYLKVKTKFDRSFYKGLGLGIEFGFDNLNLLNRMFNLVKVHGGSNYAVFFRRE